MPDLEGLKAHIGLAERIPPTLFYAPLALNWIRLGIYHRGMTLPTIANPCIEVGGLWGESKQSYLDMVSPTQRKWLAQYVTMEVYGNPGDFDRARALLRASDITFPCVAKPDIGWQGHGVQLLDGEDALRTYLRMFPPGVKAMLQEAVPWEGEAGVFYVRMPGEAKGRVNSMTLRQYPLVVGDGRSRVRDLISADPRASWKAALHLGRGKRHSGLAERVLDSTPAKGEIVRLAFVGSIRVGGLYRNADELVTPELSRRFDEIARSMWALGGHPSVMGRCLLWRV